jgi:hypothetical protein
MYLPYLSTTTLKVTYTLKVKGNYIPDGKHSCIMLTLHIAKLILILCLQTDDLHYVFWISAYPLSFPAHPRIGI